jgi:hypothetical protein
MQPIRMELIHCVHFRVSSRHAVKTALFGSRLRLNRYDLLAGTIKEHCGTIAIVHPGHCVA